jgi:hypothetical protein
MSAPAPASPRCDGSGWLQKEPPYRRGPMTCPGCPACAASRQQFIVTTTANVKAKNVEEALLDLFAGDEYEVRAASPPPEPQEWACDLCDGKGKYYPRAEVPASYEAPWCPICHGSGTVPPEPQGTDEEREG